MTALARRGLALRAPGLLGPELALAALADGLFWGHAVGLSMAAFCAAVALTAGALRPRRTDPGRAALAAAALAAALAPAVVRPAPPSLLLALFGTALSLRLCADRRPAGDVGRLGDAALLALRGPAQIAADLRRRAARAGRARAPAASRLAAWAAPAALSAAVLSLLAVANPLIAGALSRLPPSPAELLGFAPRALFWAAVAVAAWPALRPRRPGAAVPSATDPDGRWGRLAAALLSPEAVLRSLLLLDALLALQLGLDGAYLGAGLALPPGVTFAAYAHRGAYPLVASALLAAAFALAVRRPGAPPLRRGADALLALFLAENLLLVASAAGRLGLYVGAYGLTEWRVAAFAWMALVALGLLLIGLQALLGRDDRWLVARNAAAALALLYGWCCADVPGLVADYDLGRCAELGGGGPALDVDTVTGLGPAAIPAVDRLLRGSDAPGPRDALLAWRARAAAMVRRGTADWRSWSVEGWRLTRHLDRSGFDEPAAPASDEIEDP